ncbi:MAG TPA: glycosyltransferase, partial [Spirillospora sp.]|nr:glycosyltransferase [Spirillospora sp.]
MHLTFLAVGSRGDVQPFVALGQGLQKAGHTIRFATHGIFEPMIRAAGLDFAPLEGNPQAIVQGEEGRAWMESERNPVRFASGFRRLMGPVVRQAMQDALQASEGTNGIIITGPAYYFGYSVAARLNVPFVYAYLQPLHPTGAFPSALFPMPLPRNPVFNYFSHITGGQMFWQLMRPIVNQARKDFLDLPPSPIQGPFPEHMRLQIPVVYGYSPSVLPKPSNWGEFIHVTGYWFLDQPDWTPPAALVDFLNAGTPPIYIGFGSMANRSPQQLTEISLAALKRTNQRGLLLTGWGGISQSDLPDTVFKIDAAPHDWLFPRMAAVVHHGGAGTTGASLRAGKPTAIIPFFGDQVFWGERVAALGVGPRPISRKQLSVDTLAAALQRMINDETLRTKAAALGETIRGERGVENA